MSLQLIIGDANSGKSDKLVSLMVEKAMANPDEKFFAIVPEQATLKMQKDVVIAHPRHAAMNIDVVSFDRLAHVIFSELGIDADNVLDDIGKVLILRRILKDCREDLTVYKNKVHMSGFVDEMKSIITEFKQYGIDDNKLFLMQEAANEKGRTLLFNKLADIRLVYEKFNKTIKDKYQTSEEVLDLFAKVIDRSEKIKASHIYLDGYTGFTPIQYKLLESMLKNVKDVTVAITLPEEMINKSAAEHDLFKLSCDTYFKLKEAADNADVETLTDIVIKRQEEKKQEVFVCPADKPSDEILCTAKEILRLVKEEGYRFRDIAVITSDVESYHAVAREIYEEADISCFIDYKAKITDNQLSRFIMGALRLVEERVSFDSIFTYLKCNYTDIEREEIGLIENYCLEFGIKGIKVFSSEFTKENGEDLEKINSIREKIYENIKDFYFETSEKNLKAKDYGQALIKLFEKNDIEEKIKVLVEKLNNDNRLTLAKEYEQVYELATELINKISSLLGDEIITIKDYKEVLESGLREVKIGIIPPSLDAMTFGDLTRSRLDKVRALFLIGANEGKIPMVTSSSNLLSQKERETLKESFEIAPTVEEDLYTQRFYLYLMLNKPKERLYITYAKSSPKGEPINPSYLLEDLDEFIENPQVEIIENITSGTWKKEALRELASGIRLFAADNSERLDERSEELLKYFAEADPLEIKQIIEGAFFSNKQTMLDEQVALDLYGDVLKGSVSRFENFSECAYKHFLTYGLRIDERPEYRIEATDMGSLYHAALEKYGVKLQDKNISFRDITDEESTAIANECVDEALSEVGGDVLTSSKRYEFLTQRIREVTLKTTDVLREHVKAGLFEPEKFELRFDKPLDGQVAFTGKIDRVDVYDAEDVLVKIIDYKSGTKVFDIKEIYSGLQLQLAAYMSAALDAERDNHKDKNVRPAGIYYYQVNDSFKTEKEKENQFKMSGLTTGEADVVGALDNTISPGVNPSSNIIEVKYLKDGTVSGKVASEEEFDHLLKFVSRKIESIGEEIKKGNVDIQPYYKNENKNGCTFCKYKDICRFEAGHFGTDWKEAEEMSTKDYEREVYGRIYSE